MLRLPPTSSTLLAAMWTLLSGSFWKAVEAGSEERGEEEEARLPGRQQQQQQRL